MDKLIQGDYSVLDICKYIIKYCKNHSINLSNLKLQKLLFFCQANYLIQTNGTRACFEDKIQAWPYGPVVKTAYDEYKCFGSSQIENNDFDDLDNINEADAQIIEETLDTMAKYSSFKLVDITHAQDPWINAHNIGNNAEISKESIFKFFKLNNEY